MSGIHLVAVFCILAGLSQAQDNAKFITPTEYFVTVGNPITMTCNLSATPAFLVEKRLQFVHKNSKIESEGDVLSDQGVMMEKYAGDGSPYQLAFSYEPTIHATLSINGVTDEMDGEFICRVKIPSTGAIQEQVSTSVTVVAGVDTMEMTVGEDIVTDNEVKSLKFREGSIEVVCTVSGTNPEPAVHLMLGGEMLEAPINVMLDKDSPLPRRSYVGSATYTLNFDTSMFGKKLECHGETAPSAYAGDLPDKTVSVTLRGIVDEPTIYCTNNTAGVKDRKVELKCLVSKEPLVKSVSFRLRSPGAKEDKLVLVPGNKTESLIECFQEDFNSTYNAYVLRFYKMESWHFTTNIYFDVVGFDNKLHQRVLYLIKDVSAAPSLSATILLPSLCLLAMLLNTLI